MYYMAKCRIELGESPLYPGIARDVHIDKYTLTKREQLLFIPFLLPISYHRQISGARPAYVLLQVVYNKFGDFSNCLRW